MTKSDENISVKIEKIAFQVWPKQINAVIECGFTHEKSSVNFTFSQQLIPLPFISSLKKSSAASSSSSTLKKSL